MTSHTQSPVSGEQPNIAIAKQFLAFLLGPNAPVTIRLIWQKAQQFKPANCQDTHTFHNPTDADWWNISFLNIQGYSVFFVVNELDGTGGTSDANIIRIRSNFADLDNTSTATQSAEQIILELRPAIAVQSSPGKYHLYCRFPHHADHAQFRLTQQKLAARYDGDRSITNPARIMRLPGFMHQKGQPHLVTWWPVAGGQDTTHDALAVALRDVQVHAETANGTRQPLGSLVQAPSREWLQAVLDAIDPNDLGRDEWSRVYWAAMQAGWSTCQPDDLKAMLAAWCARYVRQWASGTGAGNDTNDNEGLWVNAVRHGTSTGLPTLLKAVNDHDRPTLEAELRRFDPQAAFGSHSFAAPVQVPGDMDFLDHSTTFNTMGKPVSSEVYRIAKDVMLPIGWNDFKNKLSVLAQLPWEKKAAQSYPRDWQDSDDEFFRAYLQSQPGMARIAMDHVRGGISMYADRNRFNPVTGYLNGLQWDGLPRLDRLFTHYFKAENDEFARLTGPKFLIGMVARAMQPGCKRDEMPIFEGEQGVKKSTALSILAGDEYFSDGLPNIHDKDAMQHLQGMWLIEIGELSALRKSEVEDVKRFIASKIDKFRPAFGRNVVESRRSSVFSATTNADTYLKDPTGNRRFWPIRCGNIDLDALRRDRDQLFAEAVTRYRAGERWWLDGADELALATAETDARQELDPWHEQVARYANGLAMIGLPVTLEQVMQICLGMNEPNTQNSGVTRRISAILSIEGFRRKRGNPDHSGQRSWFYAKIR